MMKCYATNKPYVGQTIHNDHKRRVLIHFAEAKNNYSNCIKLEKAINKYGKENFYHGIICECKNQDELDRMEKYYIKKYNCIKNGYNILEGGSVFVHTDETRRKISEANRKRVLSDETKKKISDGNRGKEITAKMRKAMSQAQKGRKHPESVKRKIGDAQIGKNNHRSKSYIFTNTKTGDEIFTDEGLCKFCRDNNLSKYVMESLVRGRTKKSKNDWLVRYA